MAIWRENYEITNKNNLIIYRTDSFSGLEPFRTEIRS